MSERIDVPHGGEFAQAILRVMADRKPMGVIETGTHVGLGSTQVLLAGLPPGGRIVTIECNPQRHAQAVRNLRGQPVECLLGLTIPRDEIPDAADTARILASFPPHVKHDGAGMQEVRDRVEEVAFNVPDKMLDLAVHILGGRPDLVLLDSAGHVGFREFRRLVSLLTAPCIIALDDTDHVKHWHSVNFAAADARFAKVAHGKERNGWRILHFDPGCPVPQRAP